MMDYIKVEGAAGLVRDRNTHAIMNVDKNATEQARARKLKKIQDKQEIEDLKKDVNDIKNILNLIVDKLNGA